MYSLFLAHFIETIQTIHEDPDVISISFIVKDKDISHLSYNLQIAIKDLLLSLIQTLKTLELDIDNPF